MSFLGMSDGDRLHQALGLGHQLFRLMFVQGEQAKVEGALIGHTILEQIASGCGMWTQL